MRIETMTDARAEMARHRVTQRQLAPALGLTESHLSHVMNCNLVDLTPAGAARIADAIETCAAGVAA
jgi:plasmid maintenance system antidote protein VapI